MTNVDWQTETKTYSKPHPRLRLMARELISMPHRRLLDIGCSTATLRTLLPPDFEYFGCDISDHAGSVLPPGHFLQIDFRQGCDLSPFYGRGIDAIHIGGVLEYLDRPGDLLAEARKLISSNGQLLVSLTNFDASYYRDPSRHFYGWVYKPQISEFHRLLSETGWSIAKQTPFYDKTRWNRRLVWEIARRFAPDSRYVHLNSQQFVVQAAAA